MQDWLRNHRQAGIPGKPPFLWEEPVGSRERGPCAALAPQRDREGMFGIFTSGKVFDQAAGLSLRDAAFC